MKQIQDKEINPMVKSEQTKIVNKELRNNQKIKTIRLSDQTENKVTEKSTLYCADETEQMNLVHKVRWIWYTKSHIGDT